MVKFSQSDIAFIKEYFDNHEKLIASQHVNEILFPIARLILVKGNSPDYVELNDFGRKAQQVHDNICANN